MADLKISQLPETTNPIGTDILPIVNSNATRKVTINNINNALPLTTFVRQASGSWATTSGITMAKVAYQSGFFNHTNNVDTFIRWTGVETNTGGGGAFNLVNSGTADARVQVVTPGLYMFTCDAAFFDLYGNTTFTVKLYQATGPTTSMSYIDTFSRRWYVGTTIPLAQIQTGAVVREITVANQYFTAAVLPTPGTGFVGNSLGPFPAVTDSRPTTFTIVKLA